MTRFRGSFNGEPASVAVNGDELILEYRGRTHGPRPIVGSLVNQDGKGRIWTMGLGSIRGHFEAEEGSEFTKAITTALVGAGRDFPELMRILVEMSPTVADSGVMMNRGLDLIANISSTLGESEPGFSKARESMERLVRQHADFMEHLAPRGWALTEILENPKAHVIAVKFLEHGGDPDGVDDWLVDHVLAHPRSVEIVGDIARTPVRAIWQWGFVAGEAAKAMRMSMWSTAAFTWLALAEGMWRDLRDWLGASSATFYDKGKLGKQTLTETLTRSRESLVVAHDYMSKSVRRTYLEPIEIAPTSRNALLHGRVAGSLRRVHAAKALTIVDAILEQATVAVGNAKADDLEDPPWL
jgi:hypothetical protein